jgi:hypothetical protein
VPADVFGESDHGTVRFEDAAIVEPAGFFESFSFRIHLLNRG